MFFQNHGENNIVHYTNVWYFHTTDDLNEIHEAITLQGFSYAEPVRIKKLNTINYVHCTGYIAQYNTNNTYHILYSFNEHRVCVGHKVIKFHN